MKSEKYFSIDIYTKCLNSLLLMKLQVCTQRFFLDLGQGIYSTNLILLISKKKKKSNVFLQTTLMF